MDDDEFGDFGSDDPLERYNAHQRAKGRATLPAQEDTTTRRVRRIVREGVAEAYGFDPYAPRPDDRDAPCGRCEHRYDEHAGDDWEGPCGVAGCACQTFVPIERGGG